jgi:hypothetical protein
MTLLISSVIMARMVANTCTAARDAMLQLQNVQGSAVAYVEHLPAVADCADIRMCLKQARLALGLVSALRSGLGQILLQMLA